ncbi:crk-like protein [Hydractinia symbiolongicarpus]|uniref:crk-like protein n=1 Tax=Hydractinia symbiolongicarpus TaxID=13093 RepID=UPI00254EE3B8|nr:crk-like protein [Hydractinia symbiolongicarpus]
MADRLYMYSWYHGEIGRSASESILMSQKAGLFLVRDSSTCKGGYVLSVSENRKVSHYIITHRNNQYQIGDQTFDDLPEIVEFYKRHFLDTTTLVEPAARQIDNNVLPGQAVVAPPTPANLPKVKALYNFPGKDPEDLPFKKNDVLTILKKEEAEWWVAKDSMGKEGMIPANYVEPIPSRTSFSGNQIAQSNRNRTSAQTGGYTTPNTGGILPTTIPTTVPAMTVPAIAEAVQDRTPSIYDPMELKFQKGERILVTSMRDDGSWEGQLANGKKGIFPFRYVKIITSSPEEIAAWNTS